MTEKNKKYEIRITGLGGQGVILCGHILGKAAALFDGKYSTMTQAFGPEARGSACSSQVVISPDMVKYPYVEYPDLLIALSQEAYSKYISTVADDALILYDSDLVEVGDLKPSQTACGIPATRIAEELGRKIVLNIVMMGFSAALSGQLSAKAMRRAVLVSVPPGTEQFNMKAFGEGYSFGIKFMRKLEKAAGKTATGAKTK